MSIGLKEKCTRSWLRFRLGKRRDATRGPESKEHSALSRNCVALTVVTHIYLARLLVAVGSSIVERNHVVDRPRR